MNFDRKILIQPTLQTYDEFLAFAEKQDFGFELVDFAFPNVIAGDYQSAVEAYQAKDGKDKERFISMHGAFLDLYLNSPDPDIRITASKRLKDNLQIADALDLQYCVFHTNRLPMITHAAFHKNWIKAHAEFWQTVIPQHKTTVLIENMWDESPDTLAEMLETVNSEQIKVCFDTGHFNIFSKSTLEGWFKRLGKHITYIHLNDNMGDVDNEMAVGTGTFDWQAFDAVVREYCDNPYVVLEVGDFDRIRNSLNYMQVNKIYPF